MKVARIALLMIITLTLFCSINAYSEEKDKEDEKEGSFSIEGIEVIQNRLFQKRLRHELSVSGGVLYDNAFVFYEIIPIQYTFHLRESIGFEATAAFAFGQEKGLVDSLAQPPIGVDVKVEKIKRFYMGNFVWSPIYGKFNIFASYIFHFDFFLTTGFGMMDNLVTVDNTKAKHFAFNIGAGVRIFLNDFIAMRVDFRNYTWKEGAPFNDTVNNRILTAGASFFWPMKNKNK